MWYIYIMSEYIIGDFLFHKWLLALTLLSEAYEILVSVNCWTITFLLRHRFYLQYCKKVPSDSHKCFIPSCIFSFRFVSIASLHKTFKYEHRYQSSPFRVENFNCFPDSLLSPSPVVQEMENHQQSLKQLLKDGPLLCEVIAYFRSFHEHQFVLFALHSQSSFGFFCFVFSLSVDTFVFDHCLRQFPNCVVSEEKRFPSTIKDDPSYLANDGRVIKAGQAEDNGVWSAQLCILCFSALAWAARL